MVRYLVLWLLFFIGGIFTLFVSGGTVFGLFYPTSLIVVGILPFLFVSTLFGFKEMGLAFSMPFKKETDKNKLTNGINFFKTFGKIIWLSALIAIVIGVLTMLGSLDPNNSIGSNQKFALLSVSYAAMINIMVIIPFTTFLKKQLKE